MKCGICGTEQSVRQMAMHLKWTHSMKTEDYVKLYGEFRPKNIANNQLTTSSKFQCAICNKDVKSNKELMHHIGKAHKEITQEEYIIKHIYKGIHPLCKCGCKEKVAIIRHGKTDVGKDQYHRDYILGHIGGPKPGIHTRTHSSRMKSRVSAINRLKAKNHYYNGTSKQEIEVYNFLQSFNINIIKNDRIVLSGQELDFYLPDHNVAIEFNGPYYHSDLFKPKNYHLNKTKECEAKGIRLIHIWEYDWRKSNDIIKSIITNILHKSSNKIHARKCEIKNIDNDQYSTFCQNNHLQGSSVSKVRLGLFYNNLLVSVMGLGAERKNLGGKPQQDHYELIRFCNILNTNVVGGASKLFKHFLKEYKPKNIISYANRDWSNGNLYKNLGMTFNKFTDVGYHYYKSRIRYNRFNFRKDILVKEGFDPNKTEYEIMTERGFYRVWNTGNYLFTLTIL